MAKQKTIPKLKKQLDVVFSKWVRLLETDGGKNGKCVTCGRTLPYSELDCGHFVSRNWTALRWNPINCHVQCKRCNRFLGGQIEEYFIWMENTYGRAVVDDLIGHKHDTFILERQWLLDKIKYYKDLIKEYEK